MKFASRAQHAFLLFLSNMFLRVWSQDGFILLQVAFCFPHFPTDFLADVAAAAMDTSLLFSCDADKDLAELLNEGPPSDEEMPEDGDAKKQTGCGRGRSRGGKSRGKGKRGKPQSSPPSSSKRRLSSAEKRKRISSKNASLAANGKTWMSSMQTKPSARTASTI